MQWGPTGVRSWNLPLLLQIVASGCFAGKLSTPWGPGTVHDYRSAKLTVADDVVFLGSFNLSHSGEQNAENVLEIHDAGAGRAPGRVRGLHAGPLSGCEPERCLDVLPTDVVNAADRGLACE